MKRPPIWTEEEETFLRENHHRMSAEQLAEAVGKSIHSVRNKAIRMEVAKMSKRHRKPEWRDGFTVRTAEQFAWSRDGSTYSQIDRLEKRLKEARDCYKRLRSNMTPGNRPRHDEEGELLLTRHIQWIRDAIALRESMMTK